MGPHSGAHRVTVELRNATPSEETHFLRLWHGFCTGYDMELPPEVTAFTWARLMDPSNPMTLRLACLDGTPQGFAIHQHHPSTWVMGDDGYLEDLYVDPAARGQGLGRALIEDLITIGRANGWRRLYWLTEITNATARHL